MRVHWLENVGKALDQMKQMNIHHENIGPIDIVDGNSHLILAGTTAVHSSTRLRVAHGDEKRASSLVSTENCRLPTDKKFLQFPEIQLQLFLKILAKFC
ncbi:hypothetical protein ACTXT7_010380 [Hymenolepis weldensis]